MEKDTGKNHHFRDLKCWQKGRELKIKLYQIAKSLPENEKYGLVSQIRRAAVSITANIAEGYGRFHYKENIQYCRQSRASVYECEDHLITCFDENYIDQQSYDEAISLMIETRKVTDGYIRYLEKQLHKSDKRKK
ncbi:MAG: four helix bundle protein [Calditrichaeota bacterium]|nr:MAG: four helix bundle protein [Calditrichota bacterium]MBL1204612.1 four helix bundle protein [Calditrichota bacterium]NOG44441.1 four helix bundle protein [Calditrichota bacterium]